MSNFTPRQFLAVSTLLALLWPMTIATVLAEEVNLQLKAISGLQAGQIRDGTLLVSGRITYNAAHSGFRLWCENYNDADAPQRCQLAGHRHPEQKLWVRFNGDGWQPAEGGVLLYSQESSTTFRLEADGDQAISADSWTVALSAAATH